MKKLLQIVLVSSLSLLCFSCYYDEMPDELVKIPDVPDTQVVSFGSDIQAIFTAENCMQCHNTNRDPDLREGYAYAALVPNFVTANDADASSLYVSVLGGHRDLSTDQLALIKAWINQGAEDN